MTLTAWVPRSQSRNAFLHVYEAPNGMTVVIKENHSTPIVSMGAYFRGGLRAESSDNQGITSFTQRMLMKGTRGRSAEEVASQLEFLGSSMSPFTGKDVFGATLSSLSKHFPEALRIFADVCMNPVFAKDEVGKERANILSDLEKRKDETLSYCLELCEGILYARHPYRFAIAGRETSVAALTASDLRDWHRRFYGPGEMVIALCGDLNVRHACDLLGEVFGSWGTHRVELPRLPRERPMRAIREVTERREKRQVAVALGFHAPAFGSEDYYAFDVLEHVLSGMGSRLFIELRDKQGLGYVVNCGYEPRLDMGSFKIYIGTSEDRRERARAAMLEELEKLCQQPVGRAELSRTKKYMLGLYEISLQRNSSQASRLAYYEIMGAGYRLLESYPRMIRQITADDVLRVARTYLDTRRYAIAQVLA